MAILSQNRLPPPALQFPCLAALEKRKSPLLPATKDVSLISPLISKYRHSRFDWQPTEIEALSRIVVQDAGNIGRPA